MCVCVCVKERAPVRARALPFVMQHVEAPDCEDCRFLFTTLGSEAALPRPPLLSAQEKNVID